MKKARRAQPAGRGVYGCRGTISRVMSWVIICLDLPLPAGSSNQPVTGRAALRHVSVLLRMGFTCARPVTVPAVVSYTALPPLPTPSLAARRFRRYSHSASLHARTWLRHILSETLFTILMQASARDRASDTAGLGVGGIFLLHCPGSRLRRPLAGILPCEARTFLTCSFRLRASQPRSFVLLAEGYYTGKTRKSQREAGWRRHRGGRLGLDGGNSLSGLAFCRSVRPGRRK